MILNIKISLKIINYFSVDIRQPGVLRVTSGTGVRVILGTQSSG